MPTSEVLEERERLACLMDELAEGCAGVPWDEHHAYRNAAKLIREGVKE